MDNDEALKLVSRVFDDLIKSRDVDALEALVLNDEILKRSRIDRVKYPRLALQLLPADVQELQGKYITKDLRLRTDVSSHLNTPLEKLLYALAWKNGDLIKLHHILKGVLDTSGSYTLVKGERQVFRQFGRHLADPSEPIVDKHVLRAFDFYENYLDASDVEITRLRKKDNWDKQPGILLHYKAWLSRHFAEHLQVDPQFFTHIDAVLYALGKAVKLNK